MAPFKGFIGGSYSGRALAADAERSVNVFPEKIESPTGDTKTDYVLLSKPGLSPFATLVGIPSGAITSATLNILSTHIQGTGYTGTAEISTAGIGTFLGANLMYDSTAWTLRTNSYALGSGDLSNLNGGSFDVLFGIDGSLFGDALPYDQFLIYDCWLQVSYSDGTTAILRASAADIVPYGSGTVLNPNNAFDNDQTTYATVERWHFSSLGESPFLRLRNFAVVNVTYMPPASTAWASAVLALAELNGRVFAVGRSGPNCLFYEIHPDGSSTNYGILPGDNRPQICVGETQILVLVGGNGYIFTLASSTLAPITDPNFPIGATKAAFLDGYFILIEPNSQQFSISAPNDGTSWDALDFGLVQGEPGNVVSLIADHRQLWFLSTNRGEVFYDSGNADFPFTRLDNGIFEQGIAAIDSLVRIDNSIMWLGQNADGGGIVWRASGYTPQRVSTHAIENLIQTFGTISDATGYTYQDGGHTFYVLHFPSANAGAGATLVYDSASGFWHERGWWDTQLAAYRGDLARCHCYAWGKHLVGDYRSGSIYLQSMNYSTDAGSAIRRLRSAPDLANGGEWAFYSELRLLVQGGMGLDAGVTPGGNPQIVLRVSDDGGFTWSSERSVSLGSIGQYKTLVRFRRLGRSRNRAFQIVCSEPIFFALIAADLDAHG